MSCNNCKKEKKPVTKEKLKLGGWSFEQELLDQLLKDFPPKTHPNILEFGSGVGTQVLTNHGYKVTSIEHNEKFIGKYENEQYIHAPIVNGWYDVEIVKKELTNFIYDIILIDGPPGEIGRYKFIEFWNIFDISSAVIIIDDTNRKEEMRLATDLQKLLNDKYLFNYKTFSILL